MLGPELSQCVNGWSSWVFVPDLAHSRFRAAEQEETQVEGAIRHAFTIVLKLFLGPWGTTILSTLTILVPALHTATLQPVRIQYRSTSPCLRRKHLRSLPIEGHLLEPSKSKLHVDYEGPEGTTDQTAVVFNVRLGCVEPERDHWVKGLRTA